MQWLAMVEFAYNNSWQTSTMMSLFETLLIYHLQMFYEDNHDLRSKSRVADKNAVALRDLLKELKMNLTESQELQTFYYNKHLKERIYWSGKSVRLSGKHIKTKQKLKFTNKYLGPFEIMKAVGKQAYKVKLPAKWRIIPVFHMLLLEKDIIRKKAVDQKIAN